MSEEASEVEPVPVPCATTSSDGDEHEVEDEKVVPAGQLQVEKDKEEALLASMNTAAADTLQDMDSAIRGLRDWQKQRDLEVAQLEKEHQKLLDKFTPREAGTGTESAESASSPSPASSSDPVVPDLLKELKLAETKLTLAVEDLTAKTKLSDEKLKLLTSASDMLFVPQVAPQGEGGGGGGKGTVSGIAKEESKAASSILQEADELLQSLAADDGKLCDSSNDAIAWSSDLQSVLSKLDMLDSPSQQALASASGGGEQGN